MKKLLAIFLVLTFVVSTSLTLASCTFSFNPQLPVTKQTIEKNLNEEETDTFSKVTDYLKHWKLPAFDATRIDASETAAAPLYYQNGVSAETVARTLSNRFLSEYYDSIDKTNKSLVTLTYNKLYFEVLDALERTPKTDDELLAASLTAPADYSYASQFLLAWGMPMFYAFKLMEIEERFSLTYYKADEIPTKYTLAKAVVDAYVTADETEAETIEDVTNGIIRTYVLGIGDKYAAYRTPVEYEEYDDDMSGTYVGIGIIVNYDYEEQTLTVSGFPDGSPAKEAGIALGDILFAVNGEEAKTLGYDTTIAKVRGVEGTEVTVTMQRGEEFLDFTVTRKTLPDNTVSYEIENDIAYIRISQFKANTGELFKTAVDKAEADGAKAMIFDLRSNPGGYLDSVVEALSYTVPNGTPIASFSIGSYGTITAYDDHALTVPCAVLCNGYTASAGELFTAALRDYATEAFGLLDVTVIGTETYKKGVMQNTYVLSDESTLTLTVSYYNPPSGVNYDGVGIVPDVVLAYDGGTDNQKACAVDLLTAKIAQNQ